MTISGRRILITGAAGQLAFPVATSLAETNDVWGAARFSQPGDEARLEVAGITPVRLDLASPDWSGLPNQFDHVLHFAAEIASSDYDYAIKINAEGTGLLLQRFASARSVLVVSTTAVYDPNDDPQHAFTETDPLGDSKPLYGKTYSISKIAQEATARACSTMFELPVTIARMNMSYGANGGLPAYQLDALRQGNPVPVPAGQAYFNLFHERDIVASIPALLSAATTPATIVNWAGPEMVEVRDYCRYMALLLDTEIMFHEIEGFVRSRGTDITKQVELIGQPAIGWRQGIQLLIDERLNPS